MEIGNHINAIAEGLLLGCIATHPKHVQVVGGRLSKIGSNAKPDVKIRNGQPDYALSGTIGAMPYGQRVDGFPLTRPVIRLAMSENIGVFIGFPRFSSSVFRYLQLVKN